MPRRFGRIAQEAACFSLVAAAYVLTFSLWGDDRFHFDAARYWQLGAELGDGGFSLSNHDDAHRGVTLPVLNFGLQELGAALGVGDATSVHVFGALLAATLGVVVAPRVARALFSEAEAGWGRVLALNGLLFVFWRDHFGYPLTDFPALLAASVALLGLLSRRPLGYAVAGAGLGVAANLRPAYLPAVAVAVAVAALRPPAAGGRLRRSLAAGLVVAGALFASAPQIAADHHQRGTWSPTPAGAHEIGIAQLRHGLVFQRYETYVGPRDRYPGPGVFYLDPIAIDALSHDQVLALEGYDDYLRAAARHPLRILGSYVLHAFNGLDVQYPTPYVEQLRTGLWPPALVQYALVFLAAAQLLVPAARRTLGEIRWSGLIVLTLPAAVAIPTAVEPRFFLPVSALAYILVCFGPASVGPVARGPTPRRLAFAACGLAFVALCSLLSAATRAQLQHPLTSSALAEQVSLAPRPLEDLERARARNDDEALA